MADYSNMQVPELRKAVREQFPKCRGYFASQATKKELVNILENARPVDDVLKDFYAAQAESTGNVPPSPPDPSSGFVDDADDLPEGVGGENPPGTRKDMPAGMIRTVDAELDTVIKALDTLQPTVSAEIRRLIQAELDHAADAMQFQPETLVSTGDSVKICGVDVPVISDGTGPAVPAMDPDFKFKIWRSGSKSGTQKYQQNAGDFIRLLLAGHRLLLSGPPGVGKTSLVAQFGAACGWPVTRFNCNQDITVQDFVGVYEAAAGSTVWINGPLVTAMREGHILLLDEVDHMPAECSSILHGVLEQGGKLLITAKGGEVIEPHTNFRIVGTANTRGFGDDSGLHPNAQVQDAAFLDRFDAVFVVEWLTPKAEEGLLRKKAGVNKDDAEKIVKVATDTRKAVANGTMLYPVTMRQTIAWAKHAVMLGNLSAGFALAVLNKLPSSDAAAVFEIAQRHLGDAIG